MSTELPTRDTPFKRSQKVDFIGSRIDLQGLGLELGPHVAPMFRKSEGARVRYLESRTTEELRALMEGRGRDPKIVEEIDYILKRHQDLSENVGGTTFDWVTSSHVLEHIPDFVGHLHAVASVLNEGGLYAAIVPDRTSASTA